MSTEPEASGGDWTIGRLLTWTTGHLDRHGVEEARLCAEVLLAHTANLRRIDLYARFDQVPEPAVLDRFRSLVRRAAQHEPVAYLTGKKEFFSLSFAVGPGVLIPRPETETLVECVIDHCAKVGLSTPEILDVGTGTGCIVIALLKQLPAARGCGTDVIPAALELAGANAEVHGVANRLTLCEADRLVLPSDAVPEGGFDVIVSNPPYVAADEMGQLEANVREYEPAEALTDGADGLSFYRSLAADGPAVLRPGGAVFVEIGAGRAEAVLAVLAGTAFHHRATFKDRVIGHDRVLMFSLEE